MSFVPRPAPQAYSPTVPTLTSLSTKTGNCNISCSRSPRGKLLSAGMLDAWKAKPVWGSIGAGAPMPAATTFLAGMPASWMAWWTVCTMRSTILSAPDVARVAHLTRLKILPFLSTTAVRILVPPRSTPTTYPFLDFFFLPMLCLQEDQRWPAPPPAYRHKAPGTSALTSDPLQRLKARRKVTQVWRFISKTQPAHLLAPLIDVDQSADHVIQVCLSIDATWDRQAHQL